MNFPASEPPNYNLSSKRGESFPSQQQNMRPMNDSINEVTNDYRRHKRAISVTPEKMIPSSPTPLDSNAPPPARLSMRRHSALETSLREASDYVQKEGLVPGGGQNHQHSNGLCSSPSTPGRTRPIPDEHNLFNNNMANFNNTFNQTFNSINNTHISGTSSNSNVNLRSSSSSISNNNNNYNNNITASPAGGRKFSPATPRREVVEEDDITSFLQRTSNELLESSKDVCPSLFPPFLVFFRFPFPLFFSLSLFLSVFPFFLGFADHAHTGSLGRRGHQRVPTNNEQHTYVSSLSSFLFFFFRFSFPRPKGHQHPERKIFLISSHAFSAFFSFSFLFFPFFFIFLFSLLLFFGSSL
jgi:hypothetical protein